MKLKESQLQWNINTYGFLENYICVLWRNTICTFWRFQSTGFIIYCCRIYFFRKKTNASAIKLLHCSWKSTAWPKSNLCLSLPSSLGYKTHKGKIDVVYCLSDGATTQYPNRKMFYIIGKCLLIILECQKKSPGTTQKLVVGRVHLMALEVP